MICACTAISESKSWKRSWHTLSGSNTVFTSWDCTRHWDSSLSQTTRCWWYGSSDTIPHWKRGGTSNWITWFSWSVFLPLGFSFTATTKNNTRLFLKSPNTPSLNIYIELVLMLTASRTPRWYDVLVLPVQLLSLNFFPCHKNENDDYEMERLFTNLMMSS